MTAEKCRNRTVVRTVSTGSAAVHDERTNFGFNRIRYTNREFNTATYAT